MKSHAYAFFMSIHTFNFHFVCIIYGVVSLLYNPNYVQETDHFDFFLALKYCC